MAVEARIVTRNLSLFHKGKKILNNISISFVQNTATTIIGPSGSGKSVFIKCLNRMNDESEIKVDGLVMIDNKNIYDHKIDIASLRAKIGMVFQKPHPFFMSIYDNVAYGPRIHGIINKKELHEIVIISLKKAGLYYEVCDRLYDDANLLSGGQQQRLCIARALAVEPELILMDEPCSALDPVSSSKIDNLILELKKNYTMIVVTHSMRQAKKIADFVAFFDNGSLIEYGKKDVIFDNPSNLRTLKYINSGLN
ncbi:Phosphate import ATP-binding protein PstB [Candidatus Xenohaliotis californiensis]|uniref:Phosphate import ATP-binding protein PstB n=1 Tax=Candidatus Xenohaliotis californiensis TaxID=84677 RepID=A0ABP0EUN8_9RICK|nr:Phosphate import ATP-binding protein PstB [Candidatus Xenohaliotis californiensis]